MRILCFAFMLTVIMAMASWLGTIGARPMLPAAITVICDANTETPVNGPGEYPAWELECRTPGVRVIVVD